MTDIDEINKYLTSNGMRLQFNSLQELVDAYLSCRRANKLNIEQSTKTYNQIYSEIETNYIKSLSKDTYQLSTLRDMTLNEVAQLLL